MQIVSLRQVRRMIQKRTPEGTPISEELVKAMAEHINSKYGNKVEGEVESLVAETLDRFMRYNQILKKWHGDGAQRKILRKEFFEDAMSSDPIGVD